MSFILAENTFHKFSSALNTPVAHWKWLVCPNPSIMVQMSMLYVILYICVYMYMYIQYVCWHSKLMQLFIYYHVNLGLQGLVYTITYSSIISPVLPTYLISPSFLTIPSHSSHWPKSCTLASTILIQSIGLLDYYRRKESC